jgi:hypothetical protein
MKRKIAIIIIFAFALFMILPSAGYSGHRGHPGHYYGHGYYGWLPAAIIAGTFLTGAIIIGATNRNVQPYPQPPKPYVDPGPSGYYPPPSQPYAAPDPDFAAKYGNRPTGEWVTIPGQWVGNTWVPQHKVFVPTNP